VPRRSFVVTPVSGATIGLAVWLLGSTFFAPTGCDYGLAVETNGSIKGRMFAYHRKAAVKPGETTDVREIRFDRN
jgi:hypothetical protein